MEIRNKGLLYGGLTIEQIKTEMVSERRNELIAEIFHEIHWIEKWGRGIRLILSMEPEADFKEVGTQFIVTFKRKYFEESEEKGGEGEVEKEVEKEVERQVEKLTETQKLMLRLVKESSYISIKKMSEIIGIRTSSIDKNIQTLKKKGLIKRVGPARGGHWEAIEK